MDLSIILLNYKSRGLIRQCIKGILDVRPKVNYEIIVVDNASGDGIENLKNEFPGIKIIVLEKNIGFGSGNNVGIRASAGRYILIMNPDIVVLSDSIEQLVSYMDSDSDVGILGPRLDNPDKSLQHSCYRFPKFFVPTFRRTFLGKTKIGKAALRDYLMEDFDHAEIRDVDWLLGASIVLRREMLDRIGLFDERFFLYFEDTDLCRRAWEAGSRVRYNPNIKMIHYHRRESADSSWFLSLVKPVTRAHIASWIKYFWKYRGKKLPRNLSGR